MVVVLKLLEYECGFNCKILSLFWLKILHDPNLGKLSNFQPMSLKLETTQHN